jgi:hypothetical protein
MYAGMFATYWSWSTLLMDFDNDGYKDIFLAKGILLLLLNKYFYAWYTLLNQTQLQNFFKDLFFEQYFA